jgi:predicted HTH domain antitoxin
MSVQIEIPDSVFSLPAGEVSRQVLETVALEGFKSGQLSTYQVRKMLGFESRFQVHKFLADHGIPWVDYSVDEAKQEIEILQELRKR